MLWTISATILDYWHVRDGSQELLKCTKHKHGLTALIMHIFPPVIDFKTAMIYKKPDVAEKRSARFHSNGFPHKLSGQCFQLWMKLKNGLVIRN